MNKWPTVKLGTVLRLDLDRMPVDPSVSYPMVGVLSFGRGLLEREPIENGKTSFRLFNRLKAEHVVMSQLFGWEGALAFSDEKFAARFLSPQFPTQIQCSYPLEWKSAHSGCTQSGLVHSVLCNCSECRSSRSD